MSFYKITFVAILTVVLFGFTAAVFAQNASESKLIKKAVPENTANAPVKEIIKPAVSDAKAPSNPAKPNLPVTPVIRVIDILKASPNFKTFVSFLVSTGMDRTLSQPGPYTVLAPNESAWAKIPKAELDSYTQNVAKLTGLLKDHIIMGRHTINELIPTRGTQVPSDDITLTTMGGVINVDRVPILKTDQPAANGLVDEIGGVLIPHNETNEPPENTPTK